MTQLTEFNHFLDNFKKTDLWLSMKLTRENNQYHREENVGIHTLMTIKWYKENLFHSRSEKQRMLTMIACIFHDIGKSQCEFTKSIISQQKAYYGHEQLSARIWVDFAMSNKNIIFDNLRLSIDDIANIAAMIEYHEQPFSKSIVWKQRSIKNSFLRRMGEDGHRAWLDLILSDQHGRYSDNSSLTEHVEEWLIKWNNL